MKYVPCLALLLLTTQVHAQSAAKIPTIPCDAIHRNVDGSYTASRDVNIDGGAIQLAKGSVTRFPGPVEVNGVDYANAIRTQCH